MPKKQPKSPPSSRQSEAVSDRDIAINSTITSFFDRVERVTELVTRTHRDRPELIAAIMLWRTVVSLADADAEGSPNVAPLFSGRQLGVGRVVADLALLDLLGIIQNSAIVLKLASVLAALVLQRHLGFGKVA